MSITHQVKHKLELVVKKPTNKISLSWEPKDVDMITVWIIGEPYSRSNWKLNKKKTIVFTGPLEKGLRLSIQEFEIVGKKKRKKK